MTLHVVAPRSLGEGVPVAHVALPRRVRFRRVLRRHRAVSLRGGEGSDTNDARVRQHDARGDAPHLQKRGRLRVRLVRMLSRCMTPRDSNELFFQQDTFCSELVKCVCK